jgi:hypothetical protein
MDAAQGAEDGDVGHVPERVVPVLQPAQAVPVPGQA